MDPHLQNIFVLHGHHIVPSSEEKLGSVDVVLEGSRTMWFPQRRLYSLLPAALF